MDLPINHQQETKSLAEEVVEDVIVKPELSEPGPPKLIFLR